MSGIDCSLLESSTEPVRRSPTKWWRSADKTKVIVPLTLALVLVASIILGVVIQQNKSAGRVAVVNLDELQRMENKIKEKIDHVFNWDNIERITKNINTEQAVDAVKKHMKDGADRVRESTAEVVHAVTHGRTGEVHRLRMIVGSTVVAIVAILSAIALEVFLYTSI